MIIHVSHLRRTITWLIFVLMALLYFSCGSVYHANEIKKHQRKIEKHIDWLRNHGAKISADTVWKELGIKVPELKLNFETKIVSGNTEIINFKNESGEVDLHFKKDSAGNQTVTPEIKIKERIVYQDVPVQVSTTIECKQNWKTMEVIGYLLLALIIGAGGMYLLKLFRVVP